jgi:hypothetical protein
VVFADNAVVASEGDFDEQLHAVVDAKVPA